MDARGHDTHQARRQRVEQHPKVNGIRYLEVLDRKVLTEEPLEELDRQTHLLVHCFKEVPQALDASNVLIEGGVRRKGLPVRWARRADLIRGMWWETSPGWFRKLPDAKQVLVVCVEAPGDFSTHTLSLRRSQVDPAPPEPFDTLLSRVDFSFKVECPSGLDCLPRAEAAPVGVGEAPPIDYLTRDFASFRRLMLDRLSVVAPQWKERNAADLGVALVEVLAYAADYLSYYQDAVATEAYLGTARRRGSVRRHARLLDYPMHDGCNARCWVALEVDTGTRELLLPGPSEGRPGARFVTHSGGPVVLSDQELAVARSGGAEVFESLHALTLHEAYNAMGFYTWGEERAVLSRGATSATLRDTGGALGGLTVGRVLVLEEVRGPATGQVADADPAHRHAVRLTQVRFTEDPLYEEPGQPGQALRVVRVEWDGEDALPFELRVGEVDGEPLAVARGNVVLADHGYTLSGEELPEVPAEGRYQPRLAHGPLTQVARGEGGPGVDGPASAAFRWSMEDVFPAVWLSLGDGKSWRPRRTLLDSARSSREFVAELEDDGHARLRFGDNVLGARPPVGSRPVATYRVGNGTAGNVGAEALFHVHLPESWRRVHLPRSCRLLVRNPLPASGGVDPESLERVRLDAPHAFRLPRRAVRVEDYAEAAERHPEVQRAIATLRWTGSWNTVFVTVDRRGGRPVDESFSQRLLAFLERFRLAGHDVRVEGPRYVPLDIALTVHVSPDFLAGEVKAALMEALGNRELPDGRWGFFHPDHFTFGQPVYLSRLVATAMRVPGVAWVETGGPNRFRRWDQPEAERTELLEMGRLEIARLDHDPSQPENGRLELSMRGGL